MLIQAALGGSKSLGSFPLKREGSRIFLDVEKISGVGNIGMAVGLETLGENGLCQAANIWAV